MTSIFKSQYALGLSIVMTLLLTSCAVKQTSNAADFKLLADKLDTAPIKIEVESAYPFNTNASQQVINALLIRRGDNASRIDLSGDGHTVVVGPDLVKADLPFFGERRQGTGGYGNTQQSGVTFDAAPEDYEVTADLEKLKYQVEFDTNQGAESYNVNVTVFANNTAVIYVNSSARTRMEYRGRIIEGE